MSADPNNEELLARISQLESDLEEAEGLIAEAAVLLSPLAGDDYDIRKWLLNLPMGHILIQPVVNLEDDP